MIDNHYGVYSLVCDICGESSEEEFISYADAQDAVLDIGWNTIWEKGKGWMDICPECDGDREW